MDGAVRGPFRQLQLIQRHLRRQSQEEEEDLAEVTICFPMYGSEVHRCEKQKPRTLQDGEMVMMQASEQSSYSSARAKDS